MMRFHSLNDCECWYVKMTLCPRRELHTHLMLTKHVFFCWTTRAWIVPDLHRRSRSARTWVWWVCLLPQRSYIRFESADLLPERIKLPTSDLLNLRSITELRKHMTRQSFDLWTFRVLSGCAANCANESSNPDGFEPPTSELTAPRSPSWAKDSCV